MAPALAGVRLGFKVPLRRAGAVQRNRSPSSERLASSDRHVRAALPPALARPDCDRGAFSKAFADLAARLATEVDADEIRETLHRPASTVSATPDESADANRRYRPRQCCRLQAVLAYLIDKDEESLILRFHRNEIAVLLHARPAVLHALTTERFRVRDLPGNLDDAGKLVLVRRLIREGLLRPLDQTQMRGARSSLAPRALPSSRARG